MTAKISLSKQKHPPSIPSADLCLWTTAPTVSAVNKETEKKERERKHVWGTLQSTKPQLVTPEGNVLLRYRLRDKTTSLKNMHHRQKLFEKRPQFWKNEVYRVVCYAILSALKLCMMCRYWLHNDFLLSILRVDHMCNISRHAMSGKAENLKHICSG